jgi:diaminopimelate epimerase
VRVTKLHATGNDFLVTLSGDDSPPLDRAVVAALCDRHRGVGADGLITITPGRYGADCGMTLVNADGSPAEMSGNGIRCLAWVASRAGLASGDELIVDTGAGRRYVRLHRVDGEVVAADVDMGPVTFDPAAIPFAGERPFEVRARVDGVEYCGDAAGIGNPHFVVFVDDLGAVPVARHGPQLEVDPRFPQRANVEFVRRKSPEELTMRVWERGAGETLSCGTGACAAAAVARRRQLVGDDVRVCVPGGTLAVHLGETVRLGGPVVHVFDLDLSPERLPHVERMA